MERGHLRLAAHLVVSVQKAHQCALDPGKAVADAPSQKRVSYEVFRIRELSFYSRQSDILLEDFSL
jgi:hypothetical protein